ncbi:MAG TPA: histidine kinase [Gaiellaceae bacterium]|nr:histidine kinase [Gaiellaceae bacterium]
MKRTQLAVLGAALGLTVAALVLTFTSDHEDNAALVAAGNLVAAWAFIGSGLVAWARRPANRFGLLLTAVGLTWLLGALAESNSSIPFTLGWILGGLYLAVFVHALLAFPRGYLETPSVYFAVTAAYAVVLGGGLLNSFFDDFSDECAECPPNAFLINESRLATDVISGLIIAVGVAVLGVVVHVLLRRWRAASKPLRRLLSPIYATSGASLVLLLVALPLSAVSDSASNAVWWVLVFVFASVPLSFLAFVLQTRLARAAVGDLLVDLGAAREPKEVRAAIRRALGDPTLLLGYWIPNANRYVDVSGLPFDVKAHTADEGRVATIVEHDHDLVAVLVHDASLLDQPELVRAVCAAASLALARERMVQALKGSERRYRALLHAIPDLMFRMDRSGTYLDVKGDPRDLTVPPEELLGSNVRDVLPPNVAGQLLAGVREALETGKVVTGEYRLEVGGALRDWEVRIVKDGREAALIVREITERKRQEDELRRSRARIVEAADVERRRLERNLHDGAQQRLVSLSLTLRLAQARLATDPQETERLLKAASDELALALEELRELARGIHPAVLTDRGLGAALEALAARSPLPVDLALTDERLPEPVEAAAYYVVSEALANVAKYADASAVAVTVARRNGSALVEVADDGVGGADPTRGSGLRGLADRVEALDGRLRVESSPGAGTRIRAEIPCA